MRFFSLVPAETHFRVVRLAPAAQALSALAVLASIAAFALMGLNFGIDFRGGVTVEVGPGQGRVFAQQDLTEVREAVGTLGLGDVQVQFISSGGAGTEQNIVVFVEEQPIEPAPASERGSTIVEDRQAEDPTVPDRDLAVADEDASRAAELAQQRVASEVQDALRGALGDDIVERRVDVVGPTVSGELVNAGITALLVALGLMLAYIAFAFEWQYSLGAVLALAHDVILTIGVFALTQLDFTLSIIAALLTIIGYSMNDTVVVFDRVRENLRRFKRMPLADVIDLSINQTLARTLMTSLTTLLALGALFAFGGAVLRGFSFAMIWGIVVGTYSSNFIAAPFLLRTGVRRTEEAKEGAVATAS